MDRRLLALLIVGVSFATRTVYAEDASSDTRRLLYVATPGIRNYLEYGGHGLLVFDIDNEHRFVRRIPTAGVDENGKPINVKGICASHLTKRIHISTKASLICLDMLTEKVLWERKYDKGCDRMALSPDGRIIYQPTFERDQWYVLDALSGDEIARLTPNSRAHNTVYGLDGHSCYLAGLRSPLLTVADTASHTIRRTVGPFAHSIRPFTINGRQTLAFVCVNELLGFEVGDIRTGKKLHRVEVEGFSRGPVLRHGCPSHGIGLTPDELEVWVCDAHNKRMHIFDATQMPPKQVASIACRDEPGWIAFSNDGRYAYPSSGDVIDTKTRRIVAHLTDEKDRAVGSEKLLEIDWKGQTPVLAGNQFGVGRRRPTPAAKPVHGVPIDKAQKCITGFDHNRPDPFPGLGDFIGWVGDTVRLKNGDLLFVHSAGYWHVSFATPIVLNKDLIEPYTKAGLDLKHKAPTGGRIMACRSSDNGKTWSKPELVYDGKLDAGPSATCVTPTGTVIQIINVQASWYGFPEAPAGHQKLNTRQLYIRSTDHGRTWSEPQPLNSSGTYYTRGRSRILSLPDGGLLWMSYDMNRGSDLLDGTIHRSDDDGKTWRVVSIIRRRKPVGDRFDASLVVSGDSDRFLKLGRPEGDGWIDTDEGDLGRLSNGRLVLVVRPDGGTLVSDDNAQTWRQVGRVGPSYVYAPHMVVLADDTLVLTAGGSGGQSIFLSTDGGLSWSKPIPIVPSVYGYGKLALLDDESILMAYVQKHSAPQRCMLVRFRINALRDGAELLQLGD